MINGWANSMCPSSCNHLLWLTSATSVGPFHRWRVFWAALFPRVSASSMQHLQLHQFCHCYAAFKSFFQPWPFLILYLVKLNCTCSLSDIGERHANCWRGGKKEKETAAPAILHIFPVDSTILHLTNGGQDLNMHTISQLKKLLSIFWSDWTVKNLKQISGYLLKPLEVQNKNISAALQTSLTKIRLHLWCRLATLKQWHI